MGEAAWYTGRMAKERVYLAGPDVFLREPRRAAEAKKILCAQYDFEGVFPLDAEIDLRGLDPKDAARRIRLANEDLIRSCEILIANITPFRGPSGDVGTAYEMGFARALGKSVFAYTNVEENFLTRTARFSGTTRERTDGETEDADGMQIESFGLVDNLMLVAATDNLGEIVATYPAPPSERYTSLTAFERCLKLARRAYQEISPEAVKRGVAIPEHRPADLQFAEGWRLGR
jgi:nucleoside 2-deoxyribosyltransferase